MANVRRRDCLHLATDTAKLLDESLRTGTDDILTTHPNPETNLYEQEQEQQTSKLVDTSNQASAAAVGHEGSNNRGLLRSRQLSAQLARLLLE